MSGAIANAVTEVRARIRTTGIDPVTDFAKLHHVVEDVLADSVSDKTIAPDITFTALAREQVAQSVSGFGVLQEFFDDNEVEEIWINEPGRIFVARNGKSELTSVVITESEVRALVERMLASTGRRVDLSNPFVDATLPDGSRVHVAIPDITRAHWSVNIRKFVVQTKSLNDLVVVGTLTSQAAKFLTASVTCGMNIVVSGATQAGKTTLMNALLNSAPSYDRIITCEEVFELRLESPDWVALQSRQAGLDGTGEIPLRRLIKEALRMRPHRLVIGEVRQEECLDLLIAMNSGMPSMCSLHANGARQALNKMCLLPMLAGSNVSSEFVTPTVASVVDLIVHTAMNPDGRRQVQEISIVTGRLEGSVVETIKIFEVIDGALCATGFYPEMSSGLSSVGYDVRNELMRTR